MKRRVYDAWAEFLDARARMIHDLLDAGQTPDQIARLLSCDGDQVMHIVAATLALSVLHASPHAQVTREAAEGQNTPR